MRRLITICITSFMMLGLVEAQVLKYETRELVASDGYDWNLFGEVVSISGDHAIVGARKAEGRAHDSGAAYIYERIGGVWTNETKLIASDGARYDEFGHGVSISGEHAIVGAWFDDDKGFGSGSAYIYERIGGVWTNETKLIASDGASQDYFGQTVSISGDRAIVGSHGDDDNGEASGSAYVYERIGGVWTNVAKLTASDGAETDYFGNGLSIAGDYAIVGAIGDDTYGSASGSAYIYERIHGVWTNETKLNPIDGVIDGHFGRSVSISGSYAVVGARGDDDNGSASGSAYVYERIGGVWTHVAKLIASDGVAGDQFYRVSVSGDYLIVGARYGEGNAYNSGSAYIFRRNHAGIWTEVAKLIASDGAYNNGFGCSVAISGTYAIAGAFRYENYGNTSGSAYMFELPVADAGGPYVESATGWTGARVTLDGLDSYDPDGGSLTYEWDLNLTWDSDIDGNPFNDVDETQATSDYMFPVGQTEIALVVVDEAGLASAPDITYVTVTELQVSIDIKPGSYPNSINMGSHGVIPVAFLTDDTFDAATIDPLTITLRGEDFGDGLVELRGKKKSKPMATLTDVDGDGDLDLLVKLDTEKLFDYEVDALCVLGALTYDGHLVSGSDTIRVVPNKKKFKK